MFATSSEETGSPEAPPARRIRYLPGTAAGWWAVALTVAIFPVAWTLMTHALPWPILDTAFAPALQVTLMDSAAAVGLLAVIRARDRSVLTIMAVVVAVPLAVFGTAILALEVAFPH